MQEAGIVTLFRTILIILLIYYGFKLIARFVFPLFFKRMMKNVEKKFNEQQYRNTPEQNNVKEGETVIDKAPKTQSKANEDTGEYVDYEEIE